jgi:hypothetical protein
MGGQLNSERQRFGPAGAPDITVTGLAHTAMPIEEHTTAAIPVQGKGGFLCLGNAH